MFRDLPRFAHWTTGTPPTWLRRFAWVTLAWLGGVLCHWGFVQIKQHERIAPGSVQSLAAATDYASRNAAKLAIVRRHREEVRDLGELLNHGGSKATLFNRETAAEILGQYDAISAMPSLVRNLGAYSPLNVVEAKWFYMEHYPCAQAIINMGPSSLDPFLLALRGPNALESGHEELKEAWTRKYSEIEVELAARIVLTLCDGDFDRAREKVIETKKVAIPQDIFIRMLYQLDHVLNKPGHLRHQKKPPTA